MIGIADTGFVVALVNSRDQHHNWALQIQIELSEPLLTCEAVVTEATYILAEIASVLRLFSTGVLKLDFDLESNRDQIGELARRFADQKPDLADLCVVRMSELFHDRSVVTTDRRDFAVYRRNRREAISLVAPLD